MNIDPQLHIQVLQQRLGDAAVEAATFNALFAAELEKGRGKDKRIAELEQELALARHEEPVVEG